MDAVVDQHMVELPRATSMAKCATKEAAWCTKAGIEREVLDRTISEHFSEEKKNHGNSGRACHRIGSCNHWDRSDNPRSREWPVSVEVTDLGRRALWKHHVAILSQSKTGSSLSDKGACFRPYQEDPAPKLLQLLIIVSKRPWTFTHIGWELPQAGMTTKWAVLSPNRQRSFNFIRKLTSLTLSITYSSFLPCHHLSFRVTRTASNKEK